MICPELQFFTRSISRVLLAQEGGHAACCDAIASAMAVVEKAALTGLQGALETLLAEVTVSSPSSHSQNDSMHNEHDLAALKCEHQVERLLIAEQQVTDYKQLDESISPEPTTACSR